MIQLTILTTTQAYGPVDVAWFCLNLSLRQTEQKFWRRITIPASYLMHLPLPTTSKTYLVVQKHHRRLPNIVILLINNHGFMQCQQQIPMRSLSKISYIHVLNGLKTLKSQCPQGWEVQQRSKSVQNLHYWQCLGQGNLWPWHRTQKWGGCRGC